MLWRGRGGDPLGLLMAVTQNKAKLLTREGGDLFCPPHKENGERECWLWAGDKQGTGHYFLNNNVVICKEASWLIPMLSVSDPALHF